MLVSHSPSLLGLSCLQHIHICPPHTYLLPFLLATYRAIVSLLIFLLSYTYLLPPYYIHAHTTYISLHIYSTQHPPLSSSPPPPIVSGLYSLFLFIHMPSPSAISHSPPPQRHRLPLSLPPSSSSQQPSGYTCLCLHRLLYLHLTHFKVISPPPPLLLPAFAGLLQVFMAMLVLVFFSSQP